VTESEKQQILFDFNDTNTGYPDDKTIHQLFEEQAQKTPDHTALVAQRAERKAQSIERNKERHAPCATRYSLTYRELNQKTNQLAHVLTKKGIKPDTIVGIMVERSIEMMIGILGILKSGGAYLPIDEDSPPVRTNYMLMDSAAPLLLTQRCFLESIETQCEVIPIEDTHRYNGTRENPEKVNKEKDLVYVIYTSGSTGKPKGVMIQHRSVVNRLNWMQEFYPINREDVILQKTPFVFDVSVWELFWWSLQGASLCMLEPKGEKNSQSLVEAIRGYHVTTIHFVPSMLNVFLDHLEESYDKTSLTSLKQVFSSGETLTLYHVRKFDQVLIGKKLINLYGPTEATVDVSYFNCPMGETLEKIPIGKPINNVHLYVVNRNLDLQPIGVLGELCIAGVGVARGYLNRPELTAEKFCLRHPGALEGTRGLAPLYRTGDLTRWLFDGNIEFLGRIDYQVKIRGVRIELEEIEKELLTIDYIKEAAVITKPKKNDKEDIDICAYVVSDSGKEIDIPGLRRMLLAALPGYMIPSFFVQLEKIPLTINGKVDRKSLPQPDAKAENGYIPPVSEKETLLVEIWSEVLHIDKKVIGINSNFFDLGGNSLNIIRLNNRLKEIAGKDIPVIKMFQYPSIASFLEYLGEEAEKTGSIPGDNKTDEALRLNKREQRMKKSIARIKTMKH
jgi:amino acid adenylation domain-containing protein